MSESVIGSAHGDVPMPSERSTGLVFAGMALVAAYFLRAMPWAMGVALAASASFGLVSLLRPALLRRLNIAWFRLSMLLNRIVSPIVMLILFCVAIVPFGIAMQLRHDPLRRRRTQGDTYWIARTDETPGCMSRQF